MRKARLFTLGVASVLAAVVAGAASGGHHCAAASRWHSTPGRLPDDHGRVTRGARPRLWRRGACEAHAGDLPARQQRHAIPHELQRGGGKDPRPRAGLRRSRLLAERDLGARLPGRPVRPGGVADEPVRDGAHDGGERGRPRALRDGGAGRTPARSASTSSATASAEPSRASGCAAMMPTTSCGTSSRSPRRTTGLSTARPRR